MLSPAFAGWFRMKNWVITGVNNPPISIGRIYAMAFE